MGQLLQGLQQNKTLHLFHVLLPPGVAKLLLLRLEHLHYHGSGYEFGRLNLDVDDLLV
jgi:hypothetical protein